MQKQHNQATAAEPTCCVKFMKLFLIIFNVILAVLAIVGLGIGIWTLTDDFGADNLEVIMDTDLYTAGAVLIIVGGAIILITAILGAVGAAFGNRVMLGIYFGITVFFGLLFVVGVIIGFFFMDKVKDRLVEDLKETMLNNYGVNTTTNDRNKDITTVWNDIQRNLECCGVRGGLKDTESWFLWQSSVWFETEGKATPNMLNWIYVPSSCCNSEQVFVNCQTQGSGGMPPVTDISTVTKENTALYHTGCLDALEEKINGHMIGIITVALIIFVLIVICAVFSILVCMEAGRVGKVV